MGRDLVQIAQGRPGLEVHTSRVRQTGRARTGLRVLWQAAASRGVDGRTGSQIPKGAAGASGGLQGKSLSFLPLGWQSRDEHQGHLLTQKMRYRSWRRMDLSGGFRLLTRYAPAGAQPISIGA